MSNIMAKLKGNEEGAEELTISLQPPFVTHKPFLQSVVDKVSLNKAVILLLRTN